jgi:hypothetical protein
MNFNIISTLTEMYPLRAEEHHANMVIEVFLIIIKMLTNYCLILDRNFEFLV